MRLPQFQEIGVAALEEMLVELGLDSIHGVLGDTFNVDAFVMCLHVTRLRECEVTFCITTGVWLLPRVKPFVDSQVGTCRTAIGALVALERFLLRVSMSYVDRQGALVFEALGTRLALERFLLRVHPFVRSQVALSPEALGALATLERPLLRVN